MLWILHDVSERRAAQEQLTFQAYHDATMKATISATTQVAKKNGRNSRNGPAAELAQDAEVRRIQPYQATKTYLCPGCQHDVRPGVSHLVVVEEDDVESRRHWHTECWRRELRRRFAGQIQVRAFGWCRDRAASALEARDALLEHGDRRVGDSRVDVAEGLQVEQRRGVLDVVEHEGRARVVGLGGGRRLRLRLGR